jgi:hypothetical protein
MLFDLNYGIVGSDAVCSASGILATYRPQKTHFCITFHHFSQSLLFQRVEKNKIRE